jgi:hypothetical protein
MDSRPLNPHRGFRRELALLVLLHLLAGFTLLAPGYIRSRRDRLPVDDEAVESAE